MHKSAMVPARYVVAACCEIFRTQAATSFLSQHKITQNQPKDAGKLLSQEYPGATPAPVDQLYPDYNYSPQADYILPVSNTYSPISGAA